MLKTLAREIERVAVCSVQGGDYTEDPSPVPFPESQYKKIYSAEVKLFLIIDLINMWPVLAVFILYFFLLCILNVYFVSLCFLISAAKGPSAVP